MLFVFVCCMIKVVMLSPWHHHSSAGASVDRYNDARTRKRQPSGMVLRHVSRLFS